MAKGKYSEWLEEDKLTLIGGWARNGLSEEQIAHNMGIASSTLREWKKKYPAISATIKKSKEVADLEVENAMYKAAMGYTAEETTEELKWDPKKNDWVLKVTKRVKKHVPPNVTAQIFWLKNRKPDEWREKRFVEDKIEFESDGFLDALKGETESTFEKADKEGGIVEE